MITVMSFGHRNGKPSADLLIDVRKFNNPHNIKTLRNLTGLDQPVMDAVMASPGVKPFVDLSIVNVAGLASVRDDVRVAVGCIGGRHRSVAIARAIAAGLEARGESVAIIHRDKNTWR